MSVVGKEGLIQRKENGNESVHFHNLFFLLIMQPICYRGNEEGRTEREDCIVGGRKWWEGMVGRRDSDKER